jgi:hypothetical protein
MTNFEVGQVFTFSPTYIYYSPEINDIMLSYNKANNQVKVTVTKINTKLRTVTAKPITYQYMGYL